jgi:protein-tyrosine phosphatase
MLKSVLTLLFKGFDGIMVTRVLFVCLGNICRSPSAENIMNHLIQDRQLRGQIECDSAGTSSYHIGSPPDFRMAQAAKPYGITLKGRARQFIPADFNQYDWILAMDRENYRDILALASGDHHHQKVRLMCDFCRTYPDEEVPDPYYGGPDGFKYVIDLLMDACDGFLDHVLAYPTPTSTN